MNNFYEKMNVTKFEEILDDARTNVEESKYITMVGDVPIINLKGFINENHYPLPIRWYFENKTVCFGHDTNFITVYYVSTNKLIEAIENGDDEKIISLTSVLQ